MHEKTRHFLAQLEKSLIRLRGDHEGSTKMKRLVGTLWYSLSAEELLAEYETIKVSIPDEEREALAKPVEQLRVASTLKSKVIAKLQTYA